MNIRNHNGSSILLVVIIGLLVSCVAALAIFSIKSSTSDVGKRGNNVSVFNIAEAGKEHQLARLKSGQDTLVSGSAVTYLDSQGLGHGLYSVRCSSNTARDSVWITSKAVLNGQTSRVHIIGSIAEFFYHANLGLDAALTSRASVTFSGALNIDGRDHSLNGDSIPGAPGVPGIKSCGTVQWPSSAVTVGGFTFAPSNNPDSSTIVSNMSADGYPRTPEEVLGLPDSALNIYRCNNSPPGNFHDTLIYTTSNIVINNSNAINGSGILICHNESYTAEFRIHGDVTFMGLIIVDKLEKVSGTVQIIGAIITLSSTAGATITGAGNVDILYSSAALDSMSGINIHSKRKVINTLSWKETK